jgi:hypothetical protein
MTIVTSNGARPSGGQAHSHPHSTEHSSLPEAAASASVALDIGPGRGALVLYPAERFRGREIEISSTAGGGRRVHTGVHERTTHVGSTLTAIFGSLPADEYTVWKDETTEAATVTVAEGHVAELTLI